MTVIPYNQIDTKFYIDYKQFGLFIVATNHIFTIQTVSRPQGQITTVTLNDEDWSNAPFNGPARWVRLFIGVRSNFNGSPNPHRFHLLKT